ncbi:MAG: hypothetical protein HY692_04870 [Cyanobacteria bacterium NC_groundwater_1444_Ag_S-0.65um_54_12]|nr:hypothetical protein [Cyanobacteria bacterium NC_groundwater_1444_Ag_S-0.65um_54_12]
MQIARLPDTSEQRQVVETGMFQVGESNRPLREIPVRELTEHINDRLGLASRQRSNVRTLSETYDEAIPWHDDNDDLVAATRQESAMVQQVVRQLPCSVANDSSDWRQLVAILGAAIRPLSGNERDEALNALSGLYQELVGF